MDGIKSLGLLICMLMVFMAYLKQIIPKGKATVLMKTIVSLFIVLSMIESIKTANLSNIKLLFETEFASNSDSWQDTVDLVENGMINEMNSFLKNHKIKANVRNVEMVDGKNLFEFYKVIVDGEEADKAKMLLSGRYQIDNKIIEVNNE